MFSYNLLKIVLVVSYETIFTVSSEGCGYVIQMDFSSCAFKAEREPPPLNESGVSNSSCKNETLCGKIYNISAAKLIPFSYAMGRQIEAMLSHCCGKCTGMSVVNNERKSLEVSVESANTSDIIYPIFARSSDTKLYGFWFIPLFDVPSTYYVIKAQTSREVLRKMLAGFYQLWPFICICLLLAVLAGFVVWVLETWRNKEEFPRSFFIGAFEGFWWSFVSMTTVGYGDKAPKSPTGRIFSVVWILFGITICSMLTASLTSILTTAETAPSTDMTSKRVGALKGRVYDATVIARHGGIIVEVEYTNVTLGMNNLLDKLLSGDIDGFLIDKYTYLFCSADGHMDSSLSKTVRSEKFITNERLYYGMLVKNYTDYKYLQEYIMNNWFQVSTCMNFVSNDAVVKDSKGRGQMSALSIKSGLFYPCLKNMGIVLLVICCLGLVYEILRLKHSAARETVTSSEPYLRNFCKIVDDGIVRNTNANPH